MFLDTLINQSYIKKSLLCVGLDTDLNKIPTQFLNYKDPLFEFNKVVIDESHPYAVAYKINTAFYECYGAKGWRSLSYTINYLKKNYPEIFTIADAKRGDIGNTSKKYAITFFENLDFDAVTVSPYMGTDSITPFLEFPNKWVIVLALTSNTSSIDFEMLRLENKSFLFEAVLKKISSLKGNIMFVVGATQTFHLQTIRELVPNHFLLIPGIGAQGGNISTVFQNASAKGHPKLLLNVSRDILYQGLESIALLSQKYALQMAKYL